MIGFSLKIAVRQDIRQIKSPEVHPKILSVALLFRSVDQAPPVFEVLSLLQLEEYSEVPQFAQVYHLLSLISTVWSALAPTTLIPTLAEI